MAARAAAVRLHPLNWSRRPARTIQKSGRGRFCAQQYCGCVECQRHPSCADPRREPPQPLWHWTTTAICDQGFRGGCSSRSTRAMWARFLPAALEARIASTPVAGAARRPRRAPEGCAIPEYGGQGRPPMGGGSRHRDAGVWSANRHRNHRVAPVAGARGRSRWPPALSCPLSGDQQIKAYHHGSVSTVTSGSPTTTICARCPSGSGWPESEPSGGGREAW